MNHTNLYALAQAAGEVPINEPLSAPPVNTKPNYTGNIQSGEFQQQPVTDETANVIQEVQPSAIETIRSQTSPWVIAGILIFSAILAVAVVLYIRKKGKTHESD